MAVNETIKWISVSECLPSDPFPVLAFVECEKGKVFRGCKFWITAVFEDGTWRPEAGHQNPEIEVTYWANVYGPDLGGTHGHDR